MSERVPAIQKGHEPAPPATETPARRTPSDGDVLALQRSIGNAATAALLRRTPADEDPSHYAAYVPGDAPADPTASAPTGPYASHLASDKGATAPASAPTGPYASHLASDKGATGPAPGPTGPYASHLGGGATSATTSASDAYNPDSITAPPAKTGGTTSESDAYNPDSITAPPPKTGEAPASDNPYASADGPYKVADGPADASAEKADPEASHYGSYAPFVPGGDDASASGGVVAPTSGKATGAEKAGKYKNLKSVNASYEGEFDAGSKILANFYAQHQAEGKTREESKRFMLGCGWTADDFEKYWDKAPTIKDVRVADVDKLKVAKVEKPEDYELHMGGSITQGDQTTPYDSGGSFSNMFGAGWAIFVMSASGQFYAGSGKVGLFHHSSLLAGGNTAGAGEMKISGGSLKGLTNKSGHYNPGGAQTIQVMEELGAGRLSGVKYTHVRSDSSKEAFDASAFYQQFKDNPAEADVLPSAKPAATTAPATPASASPSAPSPAPVA